MIICRFILNLRQIEPSGSYSASGDQQSSLWFTGNAGQSLHLSEVGEEDDVAGGSSAQTDTLKPDAPPMIPSATSKSRDSDTDRHQVRQDHRQYSEQRLTRY